MAMPDSHIADLAELVSSYSARYKKWYRSPWPVIGIAIMLAVTGFVVPASMHYILVTERDPAAVESELVINKALAGLKNVAGPDSAEALRNLVASQSELWSRQAVLLAQLEQKLPKRDWIKESIEIVSLLSAVAALILGVSTAALGWKNDRRATIQFLHQLEDRLASLEERDRRIVRPGN